MVSSTGDIPAILQRGEKTANSETLDREKFGFGGPLLVL